MGAETAFAPSEADRVVEAILKAVRKILAADPPPTAEAVYRRLHPLLLAGRGVAGFVRRLVYEPIWKKFAKRYLAEIEMWLRATQEARTKEDSAREAIEMQRGAPGVNRG